MKVNKHKNKPERTYTEQEVIQAIKDCKGQITKVAKKLDISMCTAYNWLDQNPSLQQEIDKYELKRPKFNSIKQVIYFDSEKEFRNYMLQKTFEGDLEHILIHGIYNYTDKSLHSTHTRKEVHKFNRKYNVKIEENRWFVLR